MLADSLLVAGMTIAVILMLVLIKPQRSFSKLLLSALLALCFFFLLYYYAFLHHSKTLGATAVLFGYGMGFLIGPLLLYYVRSLAFAKSRLIKSFFIHLIPWAVYWLVVSLPLAVSMYSGTAFAAWGQMIADQSELLNIVENIYLLAYCRLTYLFVGRLRSASLEHYSNLQSRDLNWCSLLVRGLTAVVLIDLLLSAYEWVFPPSEVVWNIGLAVALLLIVFLGLIGYRGIFQSSLFVPSFLMNTSDELSPEMSEKSGSSNYIINGGPAEIKALKDQLTDLMDSEKPFLDESLTLGDLALKMEISDKKLSELLNRHFNTSFYDFVNGYRIGAVKKMMIDPNHSNLTLLGMAFEAGFRSKTSFNRVFKQKTGMSPSAFKKQREETQSAHLERAAS